MTTKTNAPPIVHVRWMVRKDLASVLEIENECFEFPWSEEDLCRALRISNVIGMVAEDADEIIRGFVVYELESVNSLIRVLNFAVCPAKRRCGVGTSMVNVLKTKLNERRQRIVLDVRETNLIAQKFWRQMGFKCIGVKHDFYVDTTEDAYEMRFGTLPEPKPMELETRIHKWPWYRL